MWKISPLFQGIGIALLLSQALIGVYSVVGVSWMFVYFRDSFITKQDTFQWAESFRHYREDHIFATSGPNTSDRLEDTVPDYLNGVVLQRHASTSPDNEFGHLKFQLTFNLAVIWMIVFVSLSKGLRSYGKVVYVFSLVPVLGILVMSSKLLSLTPLHRGLFPQTDWSEFFLNAKSWISAATEVTLTWNLLGAATMQVTSHNKVRKKLWRDVAAISLLTVMVLILAAFLGNTCHQILSSRGYTYIPSSFERMSSYSFLRRTGSNLPPSYTIPVRHMPHASLVAGDRVGRPGSVQESGYQVIRLATELVPATLALLGSDYLSPFWAVLFYFTLILFGVAQQLAIWHCVITGIMAINAPSLKSWETTITFFTCGAGFVLGLPMTTEFGVFVVYFLDYCVGGGWWILLLTIIEICAVLMIRGRPYTGENISIVLFGKSTNCMSLCAIPMLTFSWNVIMPVALLVVCISIFKTGGYRDLWVWRFGKMDYWPLWTRIANLYRPNTDIHGVLNENTAAAVGVPSANAPTAGNAESTPTEDPPPKYTPPPSYSTATGARIAKMLRQSFRRSVRRIQSVLGTDMQTPSRPPPPDYASVLVEMNENGTRPDGVHVAEPHAYTAADVVQVLRCSVRRTDNVTPDASQSTASNNQNPQSLVIPPQWSQ
ncbi:UNVERIFIED_CONTAM: hypothetical protein PYX00_003332 [Menopon gallinae]|uniref:Uncharacterized protein n=1 Tax=Menopon gallinae TaxID=328185 RepID=A0AAW2I189_9NEOP